MDSASFEMARWDHWLLIVCFLGVAMGGLLCSWRWNIQSRRIIQRQRRRAKLARRLAFEMHLDPSVTAVRSSAEMPAAAGQSPAAKKYSTPNIRA